MTPKMIEYGGDELENSMEEDFAQSYVNNGFNGRKAAITAGWSEGGADQQQIRQRGKPRVMKRIAFLCGLRLRQVDLTIDDFTKKIKEHMDFSMKHIFGDDDKLLPVSKLSDATARCITAIEMSKDGETIKYRVEGSTGFTKMLGQYLTVISEALNRTDAMSLQKKWSDQAEELYDSIRKEAEERDKKRGLEHPRDFESNKNEA